MASFDLVNQWRNTVVTDLHQRQLDYTQGSYQEETIEVFLYRIRQAGVVNTGHLSATYYISYVTASVVFYYSHRFLV